MKADRVSQRQHQKNHRENLLKDPMVQLIRKEALREGANLGMRWYMQKVLGATRDLSYDG